MFDYIRYVDLGTPVTGLAIADSKANSDNFWFAPNTTIYDAQHSDVLKFFGVTLTGGDAGLSSIGLALGAASGSVDVAGQIIGAINLGGAVLDIARGKRALGNVYYDTFLPNIAYTTQDNGEGGIDLLVYNLLQPLIDIGFGEDNAFNDDISLDEEGQENNVLRRTGILRVKNFEFANASRSTVAGSGITSSLLSGFNAATLSDQGDFNLVFRDRNLLTVVSLLQNAVKGIPIVQSLFAALNALALGDAAAWVGAAAGRLLEGAKWSNPDDPLVIDLDGDGIEIIGLSDSRAYFDGDGDLFRERTGWLKGDDGFLVLDSNGNGRIDDISELFGNRAQGGYAELAQYDSNGDGRISVGDLIWGLR